MHILTLHYLLLLLLLLLILTILILLLLYTPYILYPNSYCVCACVCENPSMVRALQSRYNFPVWKQETRNSWKQFGNICFQLWKHCFQPLCFRNEAGNRPETVGNNVSQLYLDCRVNTCSDTRPSNHPFPTDNIHYIELTPASPPGFLLTGEGLPAPC